MLLVAALGVAIVWLLLTTLVAKGGDGGSVSTTLSEVRATTTTTVPPLIGVRFMPVDGTFVAEYVAEPVQRTSSVTVGGSTVISQEYVLQLSPDASYTVSVNELGLDPATRDVPTALHQRAQFRADQLRGSLREVGFVDLPYGKALDVEIAVPDGVVWERLVITGERQYVLEGMALRDARSIDLVRAAYDLLLRTFTPNP